MHKLSPIYKPLKGVIQAPGDKSISHRAIILGSLAKGTTTITNFLKSEDCLRTIDVCKSLGIQIKEKDSEITIYGNDLTLKEPKEPLYFGNSGTTARLMLGVLAGQPFFSSVYGDKYLSSRPMLRVVKPLRKMGAMIDGRQTAKLLPLSIRGGQLKGLKYTMPVKSAQVKSALLLAGLYAKEPITIIEKGATRDHTERMLNAFGADVETNNGEITLNKRSLQGTNIFIPGDISSASFFIVASLIVPNSSITIKGVNLNETRTGIISVLKNMGAHLEIKNKTWANNELMGDITITYQKLKGTTIKGDLIPSLIDEIPILALLATQADGKTVIKDAEELRVKETDRISATVKTLKTLGANIDETTDGMIIYGKFNKKLKGGKVHSYYDHRIAMMIVIASLIATADVYIDELESINISYPHFFKDLEVLKGNM